MRLISVLGLSLLFFLASSDAVTAALDFNVVTSRGKVLPVNPPVHVLQQIIEERKETLVRVEETATECVVLHVRRNVWLEQSLKNGDISDLIVQATSQCTEAIQTLMHAYELLRVYENSDGPASGEEYFMGPFLDQLTIDVQKRVEYLQYTAGH